MEIFDPQTGQWSAGTGLPAVLRNAAAITVNGKILLMAGQDTNNQEITQVLEYDPGTDQWSQKTPMKTARHGMTLALFEGMVWVIGGHDSV